MRRTYCVCDNQTGTEVQRSCLCEQLFRAGEVLQVRLQDFSFGSNTFGTGLFRALLVVVCTTPVV